jgi:hypothetical protein
MILSKCICSKEKPIPPKFQKYKVTSVKFKIDGKRNLEIIPPYLEEEEEKKQ